MNKTSRRDFIKKAGTLSACACAFGTASLFSSCSTAKGISGTETEDMVSVPLSSFKDVNAVNINTKKYSDPIYIAKQLDGTYLALLLHCTHKGGPLNISSDKFVCAWHHSEFSMAGALLKGPATTGLQTFKVTEENNSIVVHFI